MSREIVGFLLIVFPILLGIALIFLARWARRKNSELNASEPGNRSIDYVSALRKGNYEKAALTLFAGNSPHYWEAIGRGLSAIVILAVSVFLLFVLYAINHRAVDQIVKALISYL